MHTFFAINIPAIGEETVLDETNSKHLVQVLRMQYGDEVLLCNGKGKMANATLVLADKRKAILQIRNVIEEAASPTPLVLAAAFTKNKSRNEWLLEKVTEMGVSEIVPLICTRSEKEKFNYDRMNGILVSAMLQSQQAFLPILQQPVSIKNLVQQYEGYNKLIAHCNEKSNPIALSNAVQPISKTIIMIGPEGDFTNEEVQLCLTSGFKEVTLGKNRLRTETAAIFSAAIFNGINNG